MSASYLKAAIPEPHRILGQRLKPFSLGHYMILSRFESPFTADEPAEVNITRDDLVFAVFVCCHDYDEFFAAINHPKCAKSIAIWGTEVGMFDLADKVAAFWKYFIEGTRSPKFWEEENNASPSGTHWSHAILVTLTSRVGYSQQAALNEPFCKVLADYLRYCETEGAVRLMTDEEIAMVEQAEKEALSGA